MSCGRQVGHWDREREIRAQGGPQDCTRREIGGGREDRSWRETVGSSGTGIGAVDERLERWSSRGIAGLHSHIRSGGVGHRMQGGVSHRVEGASAIRCKGSRLSGARRCRRSGADREREMKTRERPEGKISRIRNLDRAYSRSGSDWSGSDQKDT